ncbi:MAG: hypothetical protein R2867_27885 [Caldilineaceae bacterium]
MYGQITSWSIRATSGSDGNGGRHRYSWRSFSVDTIGDRLALSENEKAALSAGYHAQLRSIRSPYGYTTWGLIACSGSKPNA